MFTVHRRVSSVIFSACLVGGGLLSALPAAADSVPSYNCVVETPSSGPPGVFQPLQVCASFDKAGYASGDVVKLTVSATNVGTATAPGVAMWQGDASGSDDWTNSPVGPLITDSTGTDIPVGDTIVSEVDGYAADPASGMVTFSESLMEFQANGTGVRLEDPVSISSSVTPATGGYSGTVFVDSDGSGRPEPGSGLAGAQVTLSGPYNGINGNSAQTYTATSDTEGDFQLTDLPAGHYWISTTGPAGWYVRPGTDAQATVDANGVTTPGLFPATPSPLPLQTSVSFDKTSYHIGDTVQVTINLTNTSSSDLHGIQAQCNPGGSGDGMWGVGSGWDTLKSPGLTVPADQTSTLRLSEIMSIAGNPANKVYLDCLFSPNPGYEFPGEAAQGVASATVSAPTDPVNFAVQFIDDDPLGGSPTCRVDLVDPASQDPLISPYGTSGPVSDLPAGTYDISLGYGTGWALAPGQSDTLNTADITNGQTVDIHVVPTNSPAPPVPPSD